MSIIERIEILRITEKLKDLGVDKNGTSIVYSPGEMLNISTYAVRVYSGDIIGAYVGGNTVAIAQLKSFAPQLIGLNPLERENIYHIAKRMLRKYDKMGIGIIDLALWDWLGKATGLSCTSILGGWKNKIPAYASTMSGDRNGGLDSPSAFADFGVMCKELGYKGYKIHIWDDYSLEEIIQMLRLTRAAVGDDMDIMLDPAGKLRTFMDAKRIARVCDEIGLLWLEDPYFDTGISAFGNRKLKEGIHTSLLLTEHVRGLEPHVDFVIAGGTDFVRVDAEYDGGLTGALKIAHAAEGLGLDVEAHSPGPVHRAFIGAVRNTNLYEMSLVHPLTNEIGRIGDIYTGDSYQDGLYAVDSEGCVPVPDGPGFGVEYDWVWIENHKSDEIIFS